VKCRPLKSATPAPSPASSGPIIPTPDPIANFATEPHAVPDGFHRIRHIGFLANRHRAEKLALCRQLLAAPPPPAASDDSSPQRWQDRLRELTGQDVEVCPCCGGRMVTAASSNPSHRRAQRCGATAHDAVIVPSHTSGLAKQRRPQRRRTCASGYETRCGQLSGDGERRRTPYGSGASVSEASAKSAKAHAWACRVVPQRPQSSRPPATIPIDSAGRGSVQHVFSLPARPQPAGAHSRHRAARRQPKNALRYTDIGIIQGAVSRRRHDPHLVPVVSGRRNRGPSPSYSAHSRDSETTIVQHINFTHRVGVTTHPLT